MLFLLYFVCLVVSGDMGIFADQCFSVTYSGGTGGTCEASSFYRYIDHSLMECLSQVGSTDPFDVLFEESADDCHSKPSSTILDGKTGDYIVHGVNTTDGSYYVRFYGDDECLTESDDPIVNNTIGMCEDVETDNTIIQFVRPGMDLTGDPTMLSMNEMWDDDTCEGNLEGTSYMRTGFCWQEDTDSSAIIMCEEHGFGAQMMSYGTDDCSGDSTGEFTFSPMDCTNVGSFVKGKTCPPAAGSPLDLQCNTNIYNYPVDDDCTDANIGAMKSTTIDVIFGMKQITSPELCETVDSVWEVKCQGPTAEIPSYWKMAASELDDDIVVGLEVYATADCSGSVQMWNVTMKFPNCTEQQGSGMIKDIVEIGDYNDWPTTGLSHEFADAFIYSEADTTCSQSIAMAKVAVDYCFGDGVTQKYAKIRCSKTSGMIDELASCPDGALVTTETASLGSDFCIDSDILGYPVKATSCPCTENCEDDPIVDDSAFAIVVSAMVFLVMLF